MATTEAPFIGLPAEIYSIIASHLPLYCAPSSLLALALTNRLISESALPLIYSCLILKNEADALRILQKLLDDPSLGRVVRELHVMSDLSHETRKQAPPDVIRRVMEIILRGYLPSLDALSVHLGSGWYHYDAVKGSGQLGKEFWPQIKENCPRLRALSLKGFNDDPFEPWTGESGLLEVSGITSLSIHFSRLRISAGDKLLHNISSLALLLHTLDLDLGHPEIAYISPVLELNFPSLRSLSLTSFPFLNTSQAMAFWERHPSIEYLNIVSNSMLDDMHWFTSVVPGSLLPNLKHLRARWIDTLLLAPILDQLLSLSIDRSVDGQIPYLLRSVCRNGLPKLKSLNIGQVHSNWPWQRVRYQNLEGRFWYEREDGTFQLDMDETPRSVYDSYMHSIARAAPNLEEIGFHGSHFSLSSFASLASNLNELVHLKHLYYEDQESLFGDGSGFAEKAFFMKSPATEVAEAVPGLVSITNVTTGRPPYMTARITRGENGEVISVDVGSGAGMKIGNEDKAFP